MFLFSDTQLVQESFLEDINNVLNTGEVPNLLEYEDINKISQLLTPECKKVGIVPSMDNIMAFFRQLVRENLHIVLCMSPVGDALRIRMRMFPSLVNCCTIDMYTQVRTIPSSSLCLPSSSLFALNCPQLTQNRYVHHAVARGRTHERV